MTSIHTPNAAHFNDTRSAQLERLEAELARIVGTQGAQALLARSRHLCGNREQSRALLIRNLLQLVRKILGKPLARWLLQSVSPVSSAQSARSRLR